MNVTLVATLIYPGVSTLAPVISIDLHRNQCRNLGEKLDATFDHLGEKRDGMPDGKLDTFRTSRKPTCSASWNSFPITPSAAIFRHKEALN